MKRRIYLLAAAAAVMALAALAAFAAVTKASSPPPFAACTGFAVGKLVESVNPVTYALPAASTAMPLPPSLLLPPR